jgi:hypothetical protein
MSKTNDITKRASLLKIWLASTATVRETEFLSELEQKEFRKMEKEFKKVLEG